MDIRQYFRDNNGRIVIAQWPNRPLWLAMGSYALRYLPWAVLAQQSFWLTPLTLGYWAWLELTDGVNAWRRTLGGFVLAWMIWEIVEL